MLNVHADTWMDGQVLRRFSDLPGPEVADMVSFPQGNAARAFDGATDKSLFLCNYCGKYIHS